MLSSLEDSSVSRELCCDDDDAVAVVVTDPMADDEDVASSISWKLKYSEGNVRACSTTTESRL